LHKARADAHLNETYRNPDALPKRTGAIRKKGTYDPPPPSMNVPDQPRKVKVLGDSDRDTLFGDFIDYADSDSDKSVRVTAPAQPVNLPSYQAMQPPPVPITATKARFEAAVHGHKRKPVLQREPNVNKDLPAPPASYQVDPADRYARPESAQGLGIDVPAHQSSEDTYSDEDAIIAGYKYGQMPEYAEDVFDDPDGIISQVDRMNNLSLQDKEYAVTEAQRLRKMFDQPPPGATGVDYQAMEPPTIVDMNMHPGHTSWRVTDFPKPNIIQSYYKQVQHQQRSEPQVADQEQRQPDAAAALMERLEQERSGRAAPRRRATSRRRQTGPEL